MDYLPGLPAVLPLEAPSSWIARAALSQAVRPRQLLDYLGIPEEFEDVDLAMLSDQFWPAVATKARFREGDFSAARRIFGQMRKLGTAGECFLLRSNAGPQFRFCPVCCMRRGTPYHPLHARFSPWLYCPEHLCLLEECCPHCAEELILPVDFYHGGPRRLGVAWLNQCVRCAGALGDVSPVYLAQLSREVLSTKEKVLLVNGRAFLAALFRGYLRLPGRPGRYSPGALTRLHCAEILCTTTSLLSADVIRDRLHQGYEFNEAGA